MEAAPLTYFLNRILEIPTSLDVLITAFMLQSVVWADTRLEQAFTKACVKQKKSETKPNKRSL